VLIELGKPVKALVRETSDPAKVAKLSGLGIPLVKGDLRDPASLKTACKSIETVIDTVSSKSFSYQPGQNDLQTLELKAFPLKLTSVQDYVKIALA
jgi:uncharacterized protein YbjT (DUF2867 family)